MKHYADHKKRFRSFLYSKVAFLIALFLLVALVHQTWGVYEKYRTTKEVKNTEAAELEQVRAARYDLEARVERLGTDRGIEEEIRTRYGLTREGEGVIIITDAPRDEPAVQEESGFFSGIWHSIRNVFSR
jgi:cell division protein FtsB